MPLSDSPTIPPLVELRNVSQQFAGASLSVLQNISLTIPRGQFVTLLGPSGCGKSTLLRIIANLLKPTSGELIQHFKPQTNSHSPVSFVFQDPRLLPWRNIYENVHLPFELGVSTADTSAMIQRVIKAVGLSGEEHKRPSMLSGGMQMRVSLARALVTQPELLLLDEPFAALDELLRFDLNLELLKLWEQQQWTAVFVTHNISEAVFLSQVVHVLGSETGGILKSFEIPFKLEHRLRGISGLHASSNKPHKDLRFTEEFLDLVQEITLVMKMNRSTP